MSKINIYSGKGIKTKEVNFPEIFREKININLLSQALRVYENRMHPGLSRVKTRSEVNRTTKKVYKQKGTGYARHGSKRAPIYVGGGIAHGPKGIKRVVRIPKKMKTKVLRVALSLKAEKGLVYFAQGLSAIKKTSDADKLLKKIFADGKVKKISVVLSKESASASKAFKNLKFVKVVNMGMLNAYDVYYGGSMLFDASIFIQEKKEKVNKKPIKK